MAIASVWLARQSVENGNQAESATTSASKERLATLYFVESFCRFVDYAPTVKHSVKVHYFEFYDCVLRCLYVHTTSVGYEERTYLVPIAKGERASALRSPSVV